MAETTNISWSDRTWSPWYGCTQVSMGEHGACVGCYARQISETRMGRVVFGGPGRGNGTRDVKAESGWKEPIRWERDAAASKRAWFAPGGPPDGGIGRPWPYSPFVFPSMCDPFDNHPDLAEPRRRFFDLLRATPHLTWLLLTKRPQNIVRLFKETLPDLGERDEGPRYHWPLNAAIGCTVVTQAEADRDVPHLLRAKAALNPAFAFLSMEPLLGPVDLRELRIADDLSLDGLTGAWCGRATFEGGFANYQEGLDKLPTLPLMLPPIDWVITGGETDQGAHKARPSHPDWFRSIRDQCAAAGVAYHHKQNGEWRRVGTVILEPRDKARWQEEGRPTFLYLNPREALVIGAESLPGESVTIYEKVGKKVAGRLLDGVEHNARPEVRA